MRNMRCRKQCKYYYGFGDASGPAFGASFNLKDHIEVEYGQWSNEASEQSSNWRELRNLVESIKGFLHQHGEEGLEMFLFTDNFTAEPAYWKGSSTSESLFDSILELKELEFKTQTIIHLVHVSGRRIIAQGTAGLSRTCHHKGALEGYLFDKYIPLDKSALERKPKLVSMLEDVFQ